MNMLFLMYNLKIKDEAIIQRLNSTIYGNKSLNLKLYIRDIIFRVIASFLIKFITIVN